MTKGQMIREIIKDVNWNESSKEEFIKLASKQHSLLRIKELYNFYLENKDQRSFVISLL